MPWGHGETEKHSRIFYTVYACDVQNVHFLHSEVHRNQFYTPEYCHGRLPAGGASRCCSAQALYQGGPYVDIVCRCFSLIHLHV